MAVDPGTTQKFRTILSSFMSSDNEARKIAEDEYDKIGEMEKFYLLYNTLGDNQILVGEAELAAVLLRRLIATHFEGILTKLPPDVITQIRGQLLARIQQDINHNLRKKISNVIAELARRSIDDDGKNHWPEFLNYLFEAANSPNAFVREIALLMFASVPNIFRDDAEKYADVIRQMLSHSLVKLQPNEVRYAAVKALSAFLMSYEKETLIHRNFAESIILMLEFLSQVLATDVEGSEEILRDIIDLVEVCPNLFRGHLDFLMQLCLKAMNSLDNNESESCRHLALEVLVTLCESAPGMIKKVGAKHIPMIINETLKMMTEIEDDPGWELTDDDDSASDNESSPVVAESSLDRMACALGGKTVLPLVLAVLPGMLQSGKWMDRHAGLMAVSAIGEGCYKLMVSMLPQILEGIMPFLMQQEPRVQYAACNAVGQMATDFAPNFQKKFAEKIVPVLLMLFSSQGSARVKAHAGAALVNFFESCPKNVLSPLLNNIAAALETVLKDALVELVEKKRKLVLEQAVVTTAAVADSAEEKFTPFYDRFMPYLKHILLNANSPELSMLRGKTIECISLIGLAVGKEKFAADASEVMDLLLKAQTTESIAADDPQLSFMIAAWARICKILGPAFKPYLPFVMQPVLRTASIVPDVAVLDPDDMKTIENDDWQFVNLDDKHNFGIRTAGLEEKATACQMLVCYARELKEGFVEYVDQVAELMVPMLKFYFHDGVRLAAAEILPCLLEIAKGRGEAYALQLWEFILPNLLQVLDSESECDVLCEFMAAFAQCVEVLNPHRCLKPEDLSTLFDLLKKSLIEHFERSVSREAKKKEEDYDEVLVENLLQEDEEDNYLISKISEIMCSLFQVYKQDLFCYFDTLLPHFVQLAEPSRSWPDRQWTLCIFADLIENTGPACSRYQEYFLQPIISSLNDENADLRQTAAYTVGILGQFGGPEYAKICSDCLPLLVQIINDPNSRSEENERATENAISAVAKFLEYNSMCINMEEVLPIWSTWLPIWEDDLEVKSIYNFLCKLLETNNALLLGNDNCNLPRIVGIFAETFHKEAIVPDSDLGKRVIALLKAIESNRDLFLICLSHLNSHQVEALKSVLTN